jgi:hypothetical protein
VVGTTLVGFGLVVWSLVVVVLVVWVATSRRTTLRFVCFAVGWPVVVDNSLQVCFAVGWPVVVDNSLQGHRE